MGFPFFEVLNYETGMAVSVAVWHVRSVRPIREMADDDETITRIEFTNGDMLDTSDTVANVLDKIDGALHTVTETLGSIQRFVYERTD